MLILYVFQLYSPPAGVSIQLFFMSLGQVILYVNNISITQSDYGMFSIFAVPLVSSAVCHTNTVLIGSPGHFRLAILSSWVQSKTRIIHNLISHSARAPNSNWPISVPLLVVAVVIRFSGSLTKQRGCTFTVCDDKTDMNSRFHLRKIRKVKTGRDTSSLV